MSIEIDEDRNTIIVNCTNKEEFIRIVQTSKFSEIADRHQNYRIEVDYLSRSVLVF